MKTQTNEQEAKNIASILSIDIETLHEKSCYLGAREMGKRKNKQFVQFLNKLKLQSTIYRVFELIESKINELSNEED
ncbi:MAG: hypothetical protein J5651_00460 [Salinivirgaceae bacterium]|nr:hypothetical protein [Salinivirgaceae bacterium]